MELIPWDEHNQALVARTHPDDWRNPTPEGRYNLVALGGGPAGLVAAVGAAGLGGRVALVERHLLGGDCLHSGCVPSKALLRSARAAHQARQASSYGVETSGIQVDFPSVMRRMRRLRAQVSHNDSMERLTNLGVDVFLGQARFTSPSTLEVGGQILRFRRAVIATGARAAIPPIEGLADTGYLTPETLFSLTEMPRRLLVIGAGPAGCELAQAFRRFGSEVHLLDCAERLLGKEEVAAARLVQSRLEQEGVHLRLGWTTLRAERTGDSKSLVIERRGEKQKLIADALLVVVGRQPNVEDLQLDAAGVRFTSAGVVVDDHLRTTNRAIYAAGDVCSVHRLTHAADAMARICLHNALFLGRKRFSRLVIPRTTYTDPEIAHVGLTCEEAEQHGIEIESYRVEMREIDRAVLDGEEEGFAVVHVRRRGGRVVGATLVGAHAGEMIGEITLLMTRGLPLAALADVIHCYPTQVEALKRIADARIRSRLTPRIAKLLGRWLAWTR